MEQLPVKIRVEESQRGKIEGSEGKRDRAADLTSFCFHEISESSAAISPPQLSICATSNNFQE